MDPWDDEEFCDTFYSKAENYWKTVTPTLNGVLGGYGYVSIVDINMSMDFLKSLPVARGCVLDCGAGIGRIAKRLLVPLFDKIDLIDVCDSFIDKAKTYVASDKVDRYIVQGLQDFMPEANRYDLIWMQWVSSHLSDADLVSFFDRCFNNLRPNGIIVLKENMSPKDYELDATDSSVTRSERKFRELFNAANLDIIKEAQQPNFPDQLYEVRAFALKRREL